MAVKVALNAFGLPAFGKYLQWFTIPIGLLSIISGALVFIPQLNQGQWYNYIFGVFCILFGIILPISDCLVFRFLLWNYLIRGVIWFLFAVPFLVFSTFYALSGVPGVLTFALSVLYSFSWLRYESGDTTPSTMNTIVDEASSFANNEEQQSNI